MLAGEGVKATLNPASTTAGTATHAEDPTVNIEKPETSENRPTQAPTAGATTIVSERTPSDAAEVIPRTPDCQITRKHAASRRSVVALTARGETRRGFAACSVEAKVTH